VRLPLSPITSHRRPWQRLSQLSLIRMTPLRVDSGGLLEWKLELLFSQPSPPIRYKIWRYY
jgi:hypothetical protein